MSKIKEVRREAIAYLSITLFLWLIGILTPYISGLYIDFLITEISFKLLIWFVVVIAVIGSLQMFCRYFMSVASTKFNQKLVASISSNIYQKIFNSRYSEYTNVDNAVELVFCHAVRVLFKNFIALQQGRHFYPSFAAWFFVSGRSNIFHGWMIVFWNLSRSFSPTGGKSLLILSFGRIFRTFFKWVQIRMKPRSFGL